MNHIDREHYDKVETFRETHPDAIFLVEFHYTIGIKADTMFWVFYLDGTDIIQLVRHDDLNGKETWFEVVCTIEEFCFKVDNANKPQIGFTMSDDI